MVEYSEVVGLVVIDYRREAVIKYADLVNRISEHWVVKTIGNIITSW